jgi:phospholipid/cholesterol/gamma-HCH transport system substrate-binding protein
LVGYVADRASTLDRILTELPPAVKLLADDRNKIADAITAVGRISKVTARTFATSRADFDQNLRLLQRPLKQLGKSSPLVIGALKLLLTAPFPIDNVPKVIRGDYLNTSLTVDLTLSALDNGLLTGTGFSGALRALEQSYGRDPNTMIPDVRFTPNPAELPPERGE